MIVSGSALTNAANKTEMIVSMRDSVEKAIRERSAGSSAQHTHAH